MLNRTAIIFGACGLVLSTASGQSPLTTAQTAKRVSPSVVVIQGKTDSGEVLGSGFIVTKDGKIVTNLHVIRDIKTASVHIPSRPLGGGWSVNGEVLDSVFVLATDEASDLAIIKITGVDLPVLELGNSDALTVGEPLVVVGSPLGLEATVTAGILSAIRNGGEGFKSLQTDAAVNPGNSGGPLVNNKGQAIGVVPFKLRSAEGLSFAIPVTYVRRLLNNLHDPMTLEQMRRSLVGRTSAPQQNSGPSLKKTLDWLKEKIPVATSSYASYFLDNLGNRISSVASQYGIVRKFDSCTVVFGFVRLDTQPEGLHSVANTFTFTNLYTVPLGTLTEWTVDQKENDRNVVSGERWGYVLSLGSTSVELSLRTSVDSLLDGSLLSPVPSTSKSVNSVHLRFNDQSIARRVSEAFDHASDLCRKKEAF